MSWFSCKKPVEPKPRPKYAVIETERFNGTVSYKAVEYGYTGILDDKMTFSIAESWANKAQALRDIEEHRARQVKKTVTHFVE